MTLVQRVLATIFFGFCLIWFLTYHYGIQNNISDSLPQKVFLVLKNTLPQKNDFVAFKAEGNGVYRADTVFVKKVAGIAGDRVSVKDRIFTVNDKAIGKAKEHSKKGMPLELGPIGTIPNGEYFVFTPHKDSFDSRYQNIGWIKQDAIIGRAIALF